MPSRYIQVSLQPGVGQAILPDHRKILPGQTLTIDYDTFKKISLQARQNILTFNPVSDSVTTASGFVPAQTGTGVNAQLNIQSALYTVSQTAINYNAAGFSAQGFTDPNTNTGVGINSVNFGNTTNNDFTGPAGERYAYVFNAGVNISGTQVVVWSDQSNRFVTNQRPTYQVAKDGLGTQYPTTFTDTTTSPSTVGTTQGQFAGVALVNIPSGYFGFIQIEGFCPAVTVSGVVNNGATLAVGGIGVAVYQPSALTTTTTNGIVSGSALSNNVFGTALVSGTNSTVAADIRSTKPKTPYSRFLNKN
jgi:hypothetical protein